MGGTRSEDERPESMIGDAIAATDAEVTGKFKAPQAGVPGEMHAGPVGLHARARDDRASRSARPHENAFAVPDGRLTDPRHRFPEAIPGRSTEKTGSSAR